MTTYRRLKKLCITNDTADMQLMEIAFDPIKAYANLLEFHQVLNDYKIKSLQQLRDILEVFK